MKDVGIVVERNSLKLSRLWLCIILTCVLFSCSSSDEDYANLNEELSANEQRLQEISNFDTKVFICENSITDIQEFLKKYSDDESSKAAKTTLTHWQNLLEKIHSTEEERLKETQRVEEESLKEARRVEDESLKEARRVE